MRSVSTLHSPPPSPHPAPLPLTSTSCLTSCPELDLSVTLSPAPKAAQTHAKSRPLRPAQPGNQCQVKPRPRGQTGWKRETQVCVEEPVIVTVIPEPHICAPPQQQVSSGSRRRRRKELSGALKPSAVPPAAASNQQPGCLERAELNTTLALKAELQSIQAAEFDSQKAVQETLQRSERTKNLINARATEVVNVSRSQQLFTSLVSVDVQEDQLISQVLQDRLLLAPPPRCHDNRPSEGPSLLAFITPDLLRQKPLPPEEEPVPCRPRPLPRPAHSTFDLYRRQRCWEATP
ncbi:protein phosphatase 1 regulatory subunit 35 [Salarias fasciatus]|uniref:Protein phosphatase 1 regulatory subunit 35-like n=1 Tax=Salarias fasciatus TaxID=181472 RepID=A0A672H3N0_SALFA|nr:protein phosphatase 1 regulatory subunit 35-like [Salarias fasciatus]XP_029945666.1 protein phosphatase 1 regulatory subunit 35-like [Salarias fasciatus]